MSIATLIPNLVHSLEGIATTTTITVTPRPTGDAVAGVVALKCETRYAHKSLGASSASYTNNDITFYILASDIPLLTVKDNYQITDASGTYQVSNATRWPYVRSGTALAFWEVDTRKVPT